MAIEEQEERSQLREIAKMMAMPGWRLYLQFLGYERERQIKLVKTAKREATFEFTRGVLNGFDSVVAVSDRLEKKIQDLDSESKEKGDDA